MEIIKVSSKSNPNKVAGAIASIYRNNKELEIQTIGAGALNQAIKAIAIARGFVAPSGDNLVVIPSFNDLYINNEAKTAIKLLIKAN
jgi:stage V sporulation protein S